MAVFGARLLHLRKLRNLSSGDLAKRMGVSLETISRLEHGKRGKRPGADIVRRAADSLGVPVYYFTSPGPKDYVKHRIRDLSPDERASMTGSGARMAWVLAHLEELFPNDEFTPKPVMVSLGTDKATFDSYVQQGVIPTPAFLQQFESATGAPLEFLVAGVIPPPGEGQSTYDDAVDVARLAGITPDELIRLIRGAQAAKE